MQTFVGRDALLRIPILIEEMIATGRWPRNSDESIRQNLQSLATPERIAMLAAEESHLYLLPPPFATVTEHAKHNKFWYDPMSAPHMIDFDLSIDIGDFGLGSDAPILLDYRDDLQNPSVIRLQWSSDGANNRWVPMAKDIQHFVDVLGL